MQNTGTVSDTFTLSKSGTWSTTLPASVTVASGATQDVTVGVQVPTNALGGSSDAVTVTATSQGDGSQTGSSTLTTTANTTHGASFSPPHTLSGDPGTTASYTFSLTNTGSDPAGDTFNITLGAHAWTTTSTASVTMGPGVSKDVTVNVTIPSSAQVGDSDAVTLTATSQADANAKATVTLTTNVNTVRGVTVDPTSAAASGNPDSSVTYNLKVTNTGSASDSFSIDIQTASPWSANSDTASPFSLAAGANKTVKISVTIPGQAPGGVSSTATVKFTSVGDGTKSATASLTTTPNVLHDVQISADSNAKSGNPGTDVTYTLHVMNTGNVQDTYDLTKSGGSWSTTGPTTPITVGAGNTVDASVKVSIPAGALAGDSDAVTITATSQADGSKTDSLTLTTTAGTVRSVTVTPETAAGSGNPGAVVEYTLHVTNTGNASDTIAISLNSPWSAISDTASGFILAAGASKDVKISVTVSTGAAGGAQNTTTARFTSKDNVTSDTATLTTTANAVYGVQVTPDSSARTGAPSTNVSYTLHVKNTGNAQDTFTLSKGASDWTTTVQSSVTVAAGATADVPVQVSIPGDVLDGDAASVTISATSQADGSKTTQVTLTTTVGIVYGVISTPSQTAGAGDPGAQVEYVLHVTNTGNTSDTFNIGISGDWPAVSDTVSGFPLLAGASTDVKVTVTVPADAAGAACKDTTVTFTSASDGTTLVSSKLTTTANSMYGVDLNPATQSKAGTPGTTISFTVPVKNTGNVADTFTFSLGTHAWTTSTPTNVTLAAGASVNVTVTVTIPAGAPQGASEEVTLTATSQGNGARHDSAALTTRVALYEVMLPLVIR